MLAMDWWVFKIDAPRGVRRLMVCALCAEGMRDCCSISAPPVWMSVLRKHGT